METNTSSIQARISASNNKKKPITVTLAAALIACLITFVLGFVISSSVMLDSRLEDAKAKNAELQETINEKEAKIDELNLAIDEKNENNIILGEQIQEHLATISELSNDVEHLESDVNIISEAALNGTLPQSVSPLTTLSQLSTSQQLIIFVLLFVVFIFIISVTCGIIASKSSGVKKEKKPKKEKKAKKAELQEDLIEEEPSEEDTLTEEDSPSEEEPAPAEEQSTVVDEAIDLLYHNNLEDSISDLGGFRFGITNFDEILSDKAKGKSFGNAENGDFVAFMTTKSSVKKLFIIPRYMTLSDSSVALRGTTDLFNITDEADNEITHGTVKVKSIDSPAVFAFGEGGWAIESKGHITALGTRH